MYRWIVLLHVVSIFTFLMAHGVSASVYYALYRERNNEKIIVLLNLSRSSLGIMLGALLLILASGVTAGFMGQWWGQLWIWISLGLLMTIYGLMYSLGTSVFGTLRTGLGLEGGARPNPGSVELTPEKVDALLSKLNPGLMTAISLGGFAIITWLMIFKPF